MNGTISPASPMVHAQPVAARTRILFEAPLVATVLLVALVLIGGCDAFRGGSTAAKPAAPLKVKADERTVRIKADPIRNRTWAVAVDHVDVYDSQTRQLIRSIPLLDWYVVDFVCDPDIIFDRSGTAFISHNLEPKLWQIDPDTFEVKQHTIRLVQREHLDIGFARLAFTRDGTLFGLASVGGSLWRIDLRSESAHEVKGGAPVLDDCAMGRLAGLPAETH